MPSDPAINDDKRTGDDLLERIIELECDGTGHGWRFLLKACGAEIVRLREELSIAEEALDDEYEACSCGFRDKVCAECGDTR